MPILSAITTAVIQRGAKRCRRALRVSPLSCWKITKLWHGAHDEGSLAVVMPATERGGFLAVLFARKSARDASLESTPTPELQPAAVEPQLAVEATAVEPQLAVEATAVEPQLAVEATAVAASELPESLLATLYAEKEMILCDIVSTVPRETSYYSIVGGGEIVSLGYKYTSAYLPDSLNAWLLTGVRRFTAQGDLIEATNLLGVASGVGMLSGLLVGGAIAYTCGPIIVASLLANQGTQLAVAQTIVALAPAFDPNVAWSGYLLMKSLGFATSVATTRYLRVTYAPKKATEEPTVEEDDEEDWED